MVEVSRTVRWDLKRCGLMILENKSHWRPRKVIQWTGFFFDTRTVNLNSVTDK